MAKPPHLDGVKSALDDLLKLEQERLSKEEAERRAREEAERRARQEEERMRREAEDARLARKRAEREELERKERDKELEEIKLKQEMDLKRRLEEEKLRMDHEARVKAIEVGARKGFPKWVIGVVAPVFVALLVGVGIFWHIMSKRADEANRRAKQEEQERIIEAKKTDLQIQQLTELLKSMQEKANLTEQELAQQKALQEQLDKLREQQEEAASGGKKRKKRRASGGEKGPGLDLGDPLSGLGM